MRVCGRLLVLAAVLQVCFGIAAAEAQTVIVRRAPAGSPVEIVVNTETVATASADERGDAIVPIALSKHVGEAEAGMNILVDACEKLRRVVLVERGVRPNPPGAGCERRDVIGLFLVRPISNVVVFVDGVSPRVLLIQGRYSLDDPIVGARWLPAPTGLTVGGGAGMRTFSEARVAACGNVSDCSGGGAGLLYTGSAALWIKRYLGAEVAFTKPSEAQMTGRGEGFEFESTFDARVTSIAGLVGVPVGSVRLYGKGGATYHQAAFRTSQTNEAVTLPIGGAQETFPSATQVFELRTSGWGWLFGGGMEIWVSPRVGLYGEFVRATLRGPGLEGAVGRLDEAMTTVVGGVKVSVWR